MFWANAAFVCSTDPSFSRLAQWNASNKVGSLNNVCNYFRKKTLLLVFSHKNIPRALHKGSFPVTSLTVHSVHS